ncbi:MAG: type IV secretion system protein TraC [Gammaproteobacteria bacterium]|nr:type IV secretion system protein TraC [Gammaproteobacteria bacterium]
MKILEIAKKLAVALDEDKGANTTGVDHKDLKKLIEVDYPSFSSILPYRYFWEEKNLFVNEHSIGFGIEMTVFSGADEKLVNSISDLLRYRIEEGMDLQFILWGSNQVGDIIDEAYKHQAVNNDIYSELAKASIQYYKKGAREGFKNRLNLPVTLRDYRLFAFLSKNTSYNDKAVAEIESARDNFTIELESAGVEYIDITLRSFLPLLRSWINPDIKDIDPRSAKHEKHSTLNEQVVDKSFELINEPERLTVVVDGENNTRDGNDGEDDGVKGESKKNNRISTKITNLSIRSLPDEFALWESPDNFFNVFRASQAIRCPFLISMHIRMIPQVDAKSKAQSMYLGMDKKAKSAYAKYFSGTQETALEWKKIRDDLTSDTVRLAYSYFNLTLFSNDGEEKKDESSAISCYRYNGIELFNTKYMQLQSFLASLPFVMSEGIFQDLKKAGRLKTLTTWNLANLLPIVADFKMSRKGVLLSSFRNQISFFDMYSDFLPTANYNIAVAATSGAGKSFLVQNILSYVLSLKGRCFVIDLGHSYRKFCEIIGGSYLEYHSLRLNPFTNIHNINESSEQIRDLFSVMASPSGGLDDVQEEYLRQAIIGAWERRQRRANIDDVIESLQELNAERDDDRIKDLVILLTRYSTKGPYPNIFNDYSAIAPDALFVVLELGELENKPDLMKAVLFALILNIEEQMYQSPRNQPKMVVIDEAWRLLDGDNKAAARFIEKGYRTARRHYGSFVTITQSIEDFQKSDEAKACWNCSDIKIIMLQNSKAFDDFMLSHENYFDPYVTSLIKQFKEAKNNGFSEFMLQTGRIQSFCRLFVDPFSRVMFSSAGKEFAAVKEYQEQGLSITESILKVAKDNYAEEF